METAIDTATHATLPGDAQGWVHLLPPGRFIGRDGRGPYLVGDAAAVIAATQGLGMDVPVDRDHQTDFAPKGTPVRAAGWIKDLQAREDGIWGRVEWTEAGAAEVAAKEYRYLSPVFEFRRGSGEVVRLVRASLTNNPNLPLTAINSRDPHMQELLDQLRAAFGLAETAGESEIVAHARSLADSARTAADGLGEVAQALGLARDAAPTAIAAQAREIARTTGATTPDPARFVPMAQFQEATARLALLEQGAAARVAADLVDGAAREGKVTPAMRDWATDYATKDRDGFTAWAKAAPVIVTPGATGGAAARPAARPAADRPLDAAELAVCAAIGVTAEEFVKSRRSLEGKETT